MERAGAIAIVLAACGGSAPATTSTAPATTAPATRVAATTAGATTPAACVGASFTLSALPSECATDPEAFDPSPPGRQVKVTIGSASSIASGKTANLEAIVTNTSDAPLQLTFNVPVTIVVTATNTRGTSIKVPFGKDPCSRDERALAFAAETEEMQAQVLATLGGGVTAESAARGDRCVSRRRIVLLARGIARLPFRWEATGTKWGQAQRSGTACTAERVPTPLLPGDYSLTPHLTTAPAWSLAAEPYTLTVTR
jgi:hypothetical protein